MMVWLDGALVSAERARIDPADRGLLLGDGLFETIAVADGRPCHLGDHLARLGGGAALLGIPMAADEVWAAALDAVLDANHLAEGSARLTLTRGPGPRGLVAPAGLTPTMLVTAAPAAAARAPAAAILARVTCRQPGSPLARLKSLGYLESILALREAEAQGGDEALLLGGGMLACGTAGSLFVVEDGRLLTPRVADGALPGLRRSRILARCGGGEAALAPGRLFGAECVFLANSLSVRGVASVDGRALRQDPAFVGRIAEASR